MKYKVSILIPTYNRSYLLERAINTSLNQTYSCEVIVCDHGSSDNTYQICKSYGDRINYIRREIDYGLHFCEIEALLAAKSKLIHFCFDDDWMHPEYIEKSLSMFNDNVGMVYCDYEVIDLEREVTNTQQWNISNKKIEQLVYGNKDSATRVPGLDTFDFLVPFAGGPPPNSY